MLKQLFTPFLIGVGVFIISFITMMSAPPLPTSIVTIIIYLIAGLWVGKIQPKSIWYAPILMNIVIWFVFIPMGMEIWPPIIHIWYFLIPPVVALPSAYIGMFLWIQIFTKKNHKI